MFFSVSVFRSFDNSEIKQANFQSLTDEVDHLIEKQESVEMMQEKIYVDVKGAVNKTGVYEMEKGDRVIDVIAKAKGFHSEANPNYINLAEILLDEMVIYVPYIGEEDLLQQHNDFLSSEKEDGKININKASIDELTTLTGIGPAKASAIVSYREENGHFQTVEDLERVSGIGKKTIENIKEFIIIK